MAEPVRPRLPRWRYPFKWVREESFWHAMTTNTLSGLLVLAITFLGGRSAGLFKQVPWHTVVTTIIASGLWATGISFIGAMVAFVMTLRSQREASQLSQRHQQTLHRHEETRRRLDELVNEILEVADDAHQRNIQNAQWWDEREQRRRQSEQEHRR
jgi:hypothetical protein